VIQVITIADTLFKRYQRGTDFIQRYIFPGGMLPSPSSFEQHARQAGLKVVQDRAFGLDYARTLNLWHQSFNAQEKAVRALGFDESFLRLWRFYLAYCEAGFRAGSTDVHQYTLEHLG
jgi:cyclopropane-fatty-acyl-phospholipid synthase